MNDRNDRRFPWQVFFSELVGTALLVWVGLSALISWLCVFLGFRKLRQYTPALLPFPYAIMVYLESPISGTSTNPARSLGPAIVSGQWQGWWIYWAGPLVGTFLAILVFSFLAKRIEVAKLYHFDSDRRRLFRTMRQRNLGRT